MRDKACMVRKVRKRPELGVLRIEAVSLFSAFRSLALILKDLEAYAGGNLGSPTIIRGRGVAV